MYLFRKLISFAQPGVYARFQDLRTLASQILKASKNSWLSEAEEFSKKIHNPSSNAGRSGSRDKKKVYKQSTSGITIKARKN